MVIEDPSPPPLVPWETDDNPFGAPYTVRSMFTSGYHRWGFLIYRCTYENQAAWDIYMHYLGLNAEQNLEGCGRLTRLGPYLKRTVVEDRKTLDGASVDAVRKHFRHWVETRSDERDGSGASREHVPRQSPRYQYCLYFDKECLDSIRIQTKFEHAPADGSVSLRGYMILIDSDFFPRESGGDFTEEDLEELREEGLTPEDLEEHYAPIDGNTEYDIGWMYVHASGAMTGMYERLASPMSSPKEARELDYRRPDDPLSDRYTD
ncbi:hypothetical protein GE09DRAFT_1215421 [Coniochaeta sp. 2T2.1]|nr:hypothetical protein GE09DRAFT_1215421 [Coniochaeta sp. 2T2.1]